MQSCTSSDFPEGTAKFDDFSTISIFFPPGRNPTVIPPDPENTGPACSCSVKDAAGSRMTMSADIHSTSTKDSLVDPDTSESTLRNNTSSNIRRKNPYTSGEVIVKFRRGIGSRQAGNITRALGFGNAQKIMHIGRNSSSVQKVTVPSHISVEEALQVLQEDPNVEYAQPNFIYHGTTTMPDDYEFTRQWGLNNTGQTVNGTTGASGNDINALAAWDTATDCSGVVIAVLDTGINYNHSDLAGSMWDGSACVDELGNPLGGCLHGYDFIENDNDPKDTNGHGTHVAGIIGAGGNDGNRISGVCWKANIMAVRMLDTNGDGTTAGAVSGIQFAINNGAKIINASWGDFEYDQALYDAVSDAQDHGVLFIAAAGNNNSNNDSFPFYPASFNLDNIISVAAIDQNGDRAYFSCYGEASVHIAAPGTNVLSSYPAQKIPAVEQFSSWKRESGWGYKVLDLDLSTAGITGLTGFLSNPSNTDDYYRNNMDSCAYRVFNLAEYGPDMATLSFYLWGPFNIKTGDSMHVVYDAGGNRPLNSFGTLDPDVSRYGFDVTPVMSDTTSLGFRFLTDAAGTGHGVEIGYFAIYRWYHYNNATACMYLNGTSMAAPHVAGAAGLVWSADTDLTYTQVKNKILNGGRVNDSLSGQIAGSRMLDAAGALTAAP